MLYDQFFIDDLKDRADLIRIIEPYAPLKKKGAQLVGEQIVRQQIAFRQFDRSRIEFVRTVPSREFKTEFWRTRSRSVIPVMPEEIDNSYVLNIESPELLFADSPDGEGYCPEVDSKDLFGLILEANPKAHGNIVIRYRTRSANRQLKSRLLAHLTRNRHVSRSRLRVFFQPPVWDAGYYHRSIEYWYLP